MFLTPYDTTTASAFNVKPIQATLKTAFVHGELPPAVTVKGSKLPGLFLVPPALKSVSPFTLPLQIEVPDGSVALALDVRGVVRDVNGQLKTVAGGEYDGQLIRGALTKAWLEGAGESMRRTDDIAGRVYIRLLSEAIVRRLNLTAYDQQAVAIVCGAFYLSSFLNLAEVTANDYAIREEKDKFAVVIARLTRINPSVVADKLNDFPFLEGLDGFCEALRKVVNSPRLEKVDAAFIVTLMGGIWFGGNARQLVAVALEYPPFWLGLVYQALTDRSYHGSQLTKLVQTEDRNGAGARFVREIADFVETVDV